MIKEVLTRVRKEDPAQKKSKFLLLFESIFSVGVSELSGYFGRC